MGKISKVFYEVVDNSVCSIMDSGEYYYHYNIMGLNASTAQEYEEYEESQIAIRNKIIGDAIKRHDILEHPKMNTTIFGVSSMKHKTIIVTEY